MTEAEFRQLVMTQRDRLHTYAVWSLGDLEAAADACQEAYTRLWQHRGRVHPAAGRAWLFKALHRLCIDHHRRRAARQQPASPERCSGPGAANDGLSGRRQSRRQLRRDA